MVVETDVPHPVETEVPYNFDAEATTTIRVTSEIIIEASSIEAPIIDDMEVTPTVGTDVTAPHETDPASI